MLEIPPCHEGPSRPLDSYTPDSRIFYTIHQMIFKLPGHFPVYSVKGIRVVKPDISYRSRFFI